MASAARGGKPEPLEGHARYEKVCREAGEGGLSMRGVTSPLAPPSRRSLTHTHAHYDTKQIRDLNSGTFGFVQLCRDKQTGELLAIKFIERGDKVGVFLLFAAALGERMHWRLHPPLAVARWP